MNDHDGVVMLSVDIDECGVYCLKARAIRKRA